MKTEYTYFSIASWGDKRYCFLYREMHALWSLPLYSASDIAMGITDGVYNY